MKVKKVPEGAVKKILFWIVLVTLFLSLIFTTVRFIMAPEETTDPSVKVKGDYTLMIFQSVVGLVSLFIPTIIERKFKVDIPNSMEVLFIIFLYAAIYLGEIRSFYFLIPYWDLLLHSFSGFMTGALGFFVVDLLNTDKRVKMMMSPLFLTIFAFSFAMTIGIVWELFEFAVDGLLGVNMQKFMLEDGTPLIGREALIDTMEDIIVDAIGAFLMCLFGYISIKCREKRKTTAIQEKQ
ncbi:MAG: hypothetical protein E7487_04365 [Ruminococcaceae bacterium]|nr:hypothetical protein [Oscillospiraceae bacterium]